MKSKLIALLTAVSMMMTAIVGLVPAYAVDTMDGTVAAVEIQKGLQFVYLHVIIS